MRPALAICVGLIQIAILIIYATACNFKLDATEFDLYYAVFQDVQVMIFVGFGFLMVFLRSYSWSAVGYNFLTAALATQIVPLWTGMWNSIFTQNSQKIDIDVRMLIRAEFGAAAVLITMGVVLGKVNDAQLCFIAIIELFFYTLNEAISLNAIYISDVGGSMIIHTFGAAFGVMCSKAFSNPKSGHSQHAKDSYLTDLIAVVGTLFLYMFWPSFNAAMAQDEQRNRAVINTYLSIAGGCVSAFVLSSILNKGRLHIDDVLNATLAGGVAIGASADLMPNMGLSIVVGMIAGTASTLGFNKLTPYFEKHHILHDSCGVTNLHLIPGIIGGCTSAIVAASLSEGDISIPLNQQFPGMAKNGWSSVQQGGYQIAFLVITLGIASVSGLLTGYFLRSKFFWYVKDIDHLFADYTGWRLPIGDGIQDASEIHGKQSDSKSESLSGEESPHSGAKETHSSKKRKEDLRQHSRPDAKHRQSTNLPHAGHGQLEMPHPGHGAGHLPHPGNQNLQIPGGSHKSPTPRYTETDNLRSGDEQGGIGTSKHLAATKHGSQQKYVGNGVSKHSGGASKNEKNQYSDEEQGHNRSLGASRHTPKKAGYGDDAEGAQERSRELERSRDLHRSIKDYVVKGHTNGRSKGRVEQVSGSEGEENQQHQQQHNRSKKYRDNGATGTVELGTINGREDYTGGRHGRNASRIRDGSANHQGEDEHGREGSWTDVQAQEPRQNKEIISRKLVESVRQTNTDKNLGENRSKDLFRF